MVKVRNAFKGRGPLASVLSCTGFLITAAKSTNICSFLHALIKMTYRQFTVIMPIRNIAHTISTFPGKSAQQIVIRANSYVAPWLVSYSASIGSRIFSE